MMAKEYEKEVALLERFGLCQQHIEGKVEQIANIEDLVHKITSVMKPVSVAGCGGHDKIGDAVAKMVDVETELLREIEEWRTEQQKINHIIAKVTDKDEAGVLYKRYTHFKPWPQVADELHCSERNAHNIHSRALGTVRALLKGENA